MDSRRNSCPKDPEGRFKLRAWRELKYIYLMEAWKSPYMEYPEQNRHNEALKASKLTPEELKDKAFLDALQEYKRIKESSRAWQLLQASYKVIDDLTLYFTTILDLDLKKEDGSPVYKAKDVIAEINGVGQTLDKLQEAEIRYKKELEKLSKIKGDQTPGYLDR